MTLCRLWAAGGDVELENAVQPHCRDSGFQGSVFFGERRRRESWVFGFRFEVLGVQV